MLEGKVYHEGKQVGAIKPRAPSAGKGDQIKTDLAEVVETCDWYDRSYVDVEGVLTIYSERICTYEVFDASPLARTVVVAVQLPVIR